MHLKTNKTQNFDWNPIEATIIIHHFQYWFWLTNTVFNCISVNLPKNIWFSKHRAGHYIFSKSNMLEESWNDFHLIILFEQFFVCERRIWKTDSHSGSNIKLYKNWKKSQRSFFGWWFKISQALVRIAGFQCPFWRIFTSSFSWFF